MAEGLHFKPFSRQGGFTAKATSGTRGNLHPAIRELFQNSLDAAINENVSVDLFIRRVSTSSVPFIETYKKHLKNALDYQKSMNAAPKSIEIGENMLECVSKSEIDILFCRDDGHGIEPDGMLALLSEGNTPKRGSSSAGSYGLGHLQAFGSSDLRYLLYASKHRDQSGQSRQIRELASGHAYLADHVIDDNGITRNYGREGFLLRSEVKNDPREPEDYLNALPSFLHPEFPDTFMTGSIIAILGFNNFGISQNGSGDYGKLAEMIKEACVNNFWMAILKGVLKVTFQDHRSNSSGWSLSDNNIINIIHSQSGKDPNKRGMPSSTDAQLAYGVYKKPKDILNNVVEGISLKIGESSDGRHRVFLFRKGMWITQNPKGLARFREINPFHCLISLDGDPARAVFRDAEGELHLGIDENEIYDAATKSTFREYLKTLRKAIIDWAGEIEVSKTSYPAIGRILKRRNAKRVTLRRNQSSKSSDDNGDDDNDDDDSDRERTRPPDFPKKGEPVQGIKSSIFHVSNRNNLTSALYVDYYITSGSYADNDIGLRVYKDDGSDSSCLRPAATSWIELHGVDDRFEKLLPPPHVGRVEVNFVDEFDADTKFKIDFVKR